jgi:ParB family chromosome partitioning protein
MKVKTIPLDDILEPRLKPRLRDDDPELAELEESIRRHGFWGTLVVRPEGEKFRLLAGFRRLTCLRRIGTKRVRCTIVAADEDQGDQITIAENLIRRDLSEVEEAYAFALYLDATESTQEELAERIGKERTYVTRRLMLLDLDDNTLGAIEDGIVSLSEALILRRVDDLDVRLKFIEHANTYGCTSRVMEYWVTDYLKRRDAIRRAEERELTADEVSVPREVMMRCDRCSEPTRYNDLETAYLCPPCYRRMVSERILETTN